MVLGQSRGKKKIKVLGSGSMLTTLLLRYV